MRVIAATLAIVGVSMLLGLLVIVNRLLTTLSPLNDLNQLVFRLRQHAAELEREGKLG